MLDALLMRKDLQSINSLGKAIKRAGSTLNVSVRLPQFFFAGWEQSKRLLTPGCNVELVQARRLTGTRQKKRSIVSHSSN